MAKKKRRTARSSGGSRFNLTNTVKHIGLTLGGVALGSYIAGKIGQKDAVSGVDLLGLDGETSSYVSPLITAAAGAAVMHYGKGNDMMKDLGTGIILAGGAKLVNKFAGKSLVSLNGTDEEQRVLLPSIAGLETDPTDYANLPAQNTWETTYNEPSLIQQPSDVNAASAVSGVLL